jgi:lysophospholipase L1-like esterase
MKKLLIPILLGFSLLVQAQQLPFKNEIEAFKTADSLNAPGHGAIVFVGSSSFRMWKNLQSDFPDHRIINRGFGGSSLPHVITYAHEIIIPYKPKQVVIYCGENDFTDKTVTSEIVSGRFKQLFHLLRKEIPGAEIVFVSMKPSPSRQHLMPQMAQANASIKSFLESRRNTKFVDIWDSMLDKNGLPRKELFLKDMLHMNENGYVIWRKALEPHLK